MSDPASPTSRARRHRWEPRVSTRRKSVDPLRAVRDVSQISEEILSVFQTAGAAIKVTVDIESQAVGKLTADQVTALRENLSALGFHDWGIE